MNTVLLVAETDAAPLRDALVLADLAVELRSPAQALRAATELRPDVVALHRPPDTVLPRVAAEFARALGPVSRVVVSLPRRDAALRDQCLVQGAFDVATEGTVEDLVARVERAAHGWSRPARRAPFTRPLRAQRAREQLELQPRDLDPTGCGLARADGLVDGELLRVGLALPDGELVAWGRVASPEGAPGVCFLGLAPDERARIAAFLDAPPAAEPRVAAAPAASMPDDATPVGPAPAPAAAEVPAPVETPASRPPSEADVLAALLDSALEHRWPSTSYEPECALDVLQAAGPSGVARDLAGAPPAAIVNQFLKTLSPLERRLFDREPPPEFADPALASRCIGLRLRLFAVSQEGERRLGEQPRPALDETLLAGLASEVNAAVADVQKLADTFLARGHANAIKDLNLLRNPLTKALTDVRGVAARLKGEQPGATNAALLDVAEPGASDAPAPVRRREPARAEKKPDKAEFVPPRRPARPSRTRLVVFGVVLVLAVVARVLTWEPDPRELAASELGGLPGLAGAVIPPSAREGRSPALVHATAEWRASPAELARLKTLLREHGVRSFRILSPTGDLLVQGRTGPADTIHVIHPGASPAPAAVPAQSAGPQ